MAIMFMETEQVASKIMMVIKIVGAIILAAIITTILLAVITWIHQTIRTKASGDPSMAVTTMTSAIFSGRVSHIRFQPKRHSFAYPLFFCLLDLTEVKKLFKGNGKGHLPLMWPLNYLFHFREEDHLKNGEGLLQEEEQEQASSASRDDSKFEDTLSPRIRRLVEERTNGKFIPSKGEKKIIYSACIHEKSPILH